MTDAASFRMTDAAKTAIAQTYNLMSDRYGDLPFWDSYGRQLVARMALKPGGTVLDVGCGAGAVSLPAAQAVGPQGRVVGVDLSNGLLEIARRRAAERGLDNAAFHHQDMTALSYPDAHFDGVASAFSIFFPNDIPGLLRDLWRMVKPGGKLAIVTWAPPIFEPLDTLLRLCAAPELPNLRRLPTNMEQVMFPYLLEKAMREAGIANPRTEAEYNCHYLPHPDDWWTMAMGSGLRRVIAALPEDGVQRVRDRMSAWIRDNRAAYVVTSVVYGTATKRRRRQTGSTAG